MKNFKKTRTLTYKNNDWVRKFILLIFLSLFINHLTSYDSFPTSNSYTFPLLPTITSLITATLIGIIININFKNYEKKHFSKTVNTKTIAYFLISSLVYITLLYIPVYVLTIKFVNQKIEFYYFLIGLLLTLLLSFIAIVLLYSQTIYKLYKLTLSKAKLIIKKGGKTIMLDYDDIAYFYSENKIVYLIKINGESITTNFILNQIEEDLISKSFFRANRQTVIHYKSVHEIKNIENNKLSVSLLPKNTSNINSEITISRYKKKAFLNWFENKQ